MDYMFRLTINATVMSALSEKSKQMNLDPQLLNY